MSGTTKRTRDSDEETVVVSSPPPIHELVSLADKCAIVTGAAQGFGYAAADRLSEAGASVVLSDLNEERLLAATARLASRGRQVHSAIGDVSREADVTRMIGAAIEQFGHVDILVNNAGVYSYFLLEDLEYEEFARVLKVNVLGAFLCTKAAAAQMKLQKSGGSIINISSTDALRPWRGLSHYDTSKNAIWGFTKTAALELGPLGIRVNAIAPGSALTEGAQEYLGNRNAGEFDSVEVWKQMAARLPLGRLCEPDDIGRVVVFLASRLSSYISGVQIVVDGGFLLQ